MIGLGINQFSRFQNITAPSSKIDGITMVAPPQEFSTDPMPRFKQTNADWIAFVPYGFGSIGNPDIRYNLDWQWWGETVNGVKKSIQLAHKQGLKVMLKPQIYYHGSWPGEVDFTTEKEWQQWESNYTKFINFYIDLALEEDVEMICIGTEFKKSIQKRPEYWRKLIVKIKKRYCGLLTYSSNWDSYNEVNIWGDLDYIGVSAYFPLIEQKTPSKRKLLKAWKPKVKGLKKISAHYNKPVLFTEFGYLSVDQCADKTWLLEKKVKSININEEAQAVSLDALFETFWKEEFWAGGFLWKWFPNGQGHEGYIERDYTPQDKKAEKIIAKWYSN